MEKTDLTNTLLQLQTIIEVIKDSETKERQFHVVMTNEIINRQGQKVLVDGIKMANFKQYAPLLWAHDWEGQRLPIGRVAKVQKKDGALHGFAEFMPEGMYDFADTVHKMVAGGYIKAVSIGGRILKYHWSDDVQNKDKKVEPYVIIEELELLELSFCPIPANPQTLVQNGISVYRQAITDGIVTEDELKHIFGLDLKENANKLKISNSSEEVKPEDKPEHKQTYYDLILGGPQDDKSNGETIAKMTDEQVAYATMLLKNVLK